MIAHKCQRHWNTCRGRNLLWGKQNLLQIFARLATTSLTNCVGRVHWIIAPICLHPDRNQLRRRSTYHFWSRAKNYCDARFYRACDDVSDLMPALMYFGTFPRDDWALSSPALHESMELPRNPRDKNTRNRLSCANKPNQAEQIFRSIKSRDGKLPTTSHAKWRHGNFSASLKQILSTHLSGTRDWWWFGHVRTREHPILFRSRNFLRPPRAEWLFTNFGNKNSKSPKTQKVLESLAWNVVCITMRDLLITQSLRELPGWSKHRRARCFRNQGPHSNICNWNQRLTRRGDWEKEEKSF